MEQFFTQFSPVGQALLGTLFTAGMTALGAAGVFLKKEISRKMLNGMLGFASGVMIAASFFSLLLPAIDMAEAMGTPGWQPAVIGFLAGGGFLLLVDKLLPHLHPGERSPEGPPSSWQRSVLLVFAITLHNIPEGLAVGVAFGAAASGQDNATIAAAVALALGIGLQNFPEGLAVSAPLRREDMSRWKAFLFGAASGIVEPIAAVAGVLAVQSIRGVLPYALAFAAGAKIYVVAEELIPEAKANSQGHSDVPTIGVLLGFAAMMLLDVALG